MKNKIAAVFLGILLLAAGLGMLSAQKVHAHEESSLIVNGQIVEVNHSGPYPSGDSMMIPLREAAEALKFKATYQRSPETLQLNGINKKIEFTPAKQEIILNGKDKVQYKDKIEFKQGHLYVPLSFFTSIGLISTYDPDADRVEIYSPEVAAGAITGLLAAGKYQELRDRYLDEDSPKELSLNSLRVKWEQTALPAGNYFGIKSTESGWQDDKMLIRSVLSFTGSEAVLTLTLNEAGKIIALSLDPLVSEQEL